jgi:2-oxoglutarate ferredoxin oxidoreductase subunit alpha
MNREALKEIEGLIDQGQRPLAELLCPGLAFWMFDRPSGRDVDWMRKKFAKKPAVMEGNIRSLETGYHFGETSRVFQHRYRIRPAALPPGTYRKVTGNTALALGLVTAAQKMGKPLFYGTYPITPASDILHALAPLRNFDVRTFQAEDEIAAMGSVIGAPLAARWPSPAPAALASP